MSTPTEDPRHPGPSAETWGGEASEGLWLRPTNNLPTLGPEGSNALYTSGLPGHPNCSQIVLGAPEAVAGGSRVPYIFLRVLPLGFLGWSCGAWGRRLPWPGTRKDGYGFYDKKRTIPIPKISEARTQYKWTFIVIPCTAAATEK